MNKAIYDVRTIEEIAKLLDQLSVAGIKNVSIVMRICDLLNNNIKDNEDIVKQKEV